MAEGRQGAQAHVPDAPHPGGLPDAAAADLPRGQGIYANRNLRLDCIEAVGFDMDYTLARYARANLEVLAHRLTLEKLVARGYPQEVLDLPYVPAFVIRGLVVDKLLGNIIKLDRHNHPCRVYHGRTPLDRERRRATYRRERIAFAPPRFALVDTLFSLPEVSIYAHLVDFFDARPPQEAGASPWPNYAQLFDDVRQAIDEAHRDGSLKTVVQQDLPHYIERDPKLPQILRELRQAGKKLFLLTNSAWKYTHAVMNFLLGEGAETAAEASQTAASWSQFFDLVIVSAQKPEYFARPDELAPLVAAADEATPPAHAFGGGSLPATERFLGSKGEAILYVGDHIFGDILRSKKTSLWRTALVVEELEDEVCLTHQLTQDVRALEALEKRRHQLDLELVLGRHAVTAEGHQLLPSLGQDRAQKRVARDQVLAQIQSRQEAIAAAFNPYWGMVFKEEHENSRFGEQVASYACLYMARVTSFAYYPADQYFRSPRDYLPHEPREAQEAGEAFAAPPPCRCGSPLPPPNARVGG